MLNLLKIRRIGASKHKSAQFIALSLYFPGKDKVEQQVYVSIKCKLDLIDSFQANILVKNNILSLKGFVINIKKNCTFIESCKVTIPINARLRK